MPTRRKFLAANLIGAAGLATNPLPIFSTPTESAAVPATQTSTRSDRDFWSDWPVLLTGAMNQARDRRLAALAEVRSAAQVQQRIAFVRSKLWELIGGEPERTPLHPRITGSMDLGPYRIENIIFESFPKVYVTANLYLPTSGRPPYPAILAPVGHSQNGKAYHYYQHLYQNLSRQGYVVLAYDPFGQGERLQYIDPKTGRSIYGPTGEHSKAGRPMVLMGETFALYCAWDGIRGLDYLLSRPEVDATRLGCTGQSGGGTMTMYLAALEPRLHAAVVCDGNTEDVAGPFFDPPGGTDDAEQNIVGGLPFGIDRGDLVLAFAPKPLLICYTTNDEGETYSPVYQESTGNIHREMQRVYALMGAKERAGLFATHLPHSLDFLSRAQVYAWFNRWLRNSTDKITEAPLDHIPEEKLHATSTGQVLTSLGGRSVVQLNADRAEIVISKSQFLNARMDTPKIRTEASTALAGLLALPRQRSPLHSRVRSSNPRNGVVIEEVQFESEPGMRIPGWFVKPSESGHKLPTVLYLTDDGGDDVVAEPGSMESLVAAGYAVCAISPRGLGLTAPRFPHEGPNYYSGLPLKERFAWSCLVLGRPIVGQRVWDTLRAIDYLIGRPDVDASTLRVAGVRNLGLAAIMAATLDQRVHSVLADRTLVSFASIVQSNTYSIDLAWFVSGILHKFDLPQIVATIHPRPVWILNGTDANGEVLSEASLRQQYSQGMPHEVPPPSTLRLVVNLEQDPQVSYLDWLRTS